MATIEMPARSQQEDGNEQMRYPGLQEPVQHLPETRFQHAIADHVNTRPITLRELRMLAFVNQITDKSNWQVKVFDDAILAKWKEEASEIELDNGDQDPFLSDQMFKHCVEELQDKADRFRSTGFVTVLDTDEYCTITKSDSAISSELQGELKALVKPLEDVPEELKDWHPGSDGMVLDIVHPSLFPLILGKTPALVTGTVPLDHCIMYARSGEVTRSAPDGQDAVFRRPPTFTGDSEFARGWGGYQWLPSAVRFNEHGEAQITSYINNLHPGHHAQLYHTLEKVIDAVIPLWNEVLTQYDSRRLRINVNTTSDEDYIPIKGRKYPHEATPGGVTVVQKENNDDDTDEELMWDSDYRNFKRENSILNYPEPDKFCCHEDLMKSESTKAVNLIDSFRKTGLQIIFKLANIILTPESPTYDGGSWHIEGAMNEHIAATAVVYYDQENITDSHLSFRHSIGAEDMIMMPAQGEFDSACQFFGVEDQGTNEQVIGSVLTKAGRLLCFPNTIQHCVDEFELVDASKPGHRKILAMFLVDPHIPILSTANVPPQRQDWWVEEVLKIPQFGQLPVEVFKGIVDAADGLMTWEEAVEVREKLMDERSVINDESLQTLVDTFNFCEH